MKKSIFLAVLASLSLVACTTPSDPTTDPTTNSTISEPTTSVEGPTTVSTQPSVSDPIVTDPTTSIDPTVPDVTEDPTTSVDPTVPDVTEDPTTPEIPNQPEIPEETEAGKIRLYFLAESWWYEMGEYSTAVYTDSILYPGEVMYLVEEIGTKAVFAYDVDLSATTEIGFVAVAKGEYLPTDSVSIIDVIMDTKTISIIDLGNNNLIALNEDEKDTSRSLSVFSDTYVPGQGEYERPEEPIEPTVDTFKVTFQNNWLWTDVKIYYWGSKSVTDEIWPGESMPLAEVTDTTYEYYTFELSTDIAGFIINGIKNDGSGYRDQTPDITPDDPNFFNENGYWSMLWADGNKVEFHAF